MVLRLFLEDLNTIATDTDNENSLSVSYLKESFVHARWQPLNKLQSLTS
jgi:hypothetical protein